MSSIDSSDLLLELINQGRALIGVPDLVAAYIDMADDNIFRESLELNFTNDSDLVSSSDAESLVKKEIQSILSSSNSDTKQVFLSRYATHLDSEIISETSDSIRLHINIFYKYLELEPIGKAIGGDLVIQGKLSNPLFGPAWCCVEFAADHEEEFQEIVKVAPWEMIVQFPSPENGEDIDGTNPPFSIPISLGPSFQDREGSLKLTIYIAPIENLPYSEESPSFSFSSKDPFVCAAQFLTRATGESSINGGGGGVGGGGGGSIHGGDSLTESEKLNQLARERGERGERGSIDDGRPPRININGREGQGQGEGIAGGLETGDGDGDLYLKDIRVCADMDDLSSWRAEGYILASSHLTADGSELRDEDHLWPFFIVASYGSKDSLLPLHSPMIRGEGMVGQEQGVEDVIWVKCPKVLSGLDSDEPPEVSVPSGYTAIVDVDLAGPDEPYSVFLAVKFGPNPSFSKLIMLSASTGADDSLLLYCASGCVFRPAPMEVVGQIGGGTESAGLWLKIIEETDSNALTPTSNMSPNPQSYPSTGGGGGGGNSNSLIEESTRTSRSISSSSSSHTSQKNHSKMNNNNSSKFSSHHSEDGGMGGMSSARLSSKASDAGNSNDSDEDEEFYNEDEAIIALTQKLTVLESEKQGLLNMNLELQRKCAQLLLKEKNLQGQGGVKGGTGGGGGGGAQPIPDTTGGTGGGGGGGILDDSAQEQLQEKEKIFYDNLQLIVEGRDKLSRQQRDFDQLALDLQMRLDDKEFKANEISETFRKFKKDILERTENSRTGQKISDRLIEQFESTERKHEEELEKVRLRNISLRTTLRKLERSLRSREQLAEGLHMIDFEQLKIENQTLNEKIEERNEELAKLKTKKTNTVQVLTHIREKLRHIEKNNASLAIELKTLEQEIFIRRSDVTEGKHIREGLKFENKELKRQQGFATNDMLLLDYEKIADNVESMETTIRELKDRYRILSKQLQKHSSTTTSSSSTTTSTSTSVGGGMGGGRVGGMGKGGVGGGNSLLSTSSFS